MSQVSYGTITITDTNDIESIVIEYNKNQSNQNPPSEGDSNWSTNRPTWQQGYYIWQRTRIHKSGTATTADIIGTPVCVTGSTGEQGQQGTAGRSLTGVETEYCIYGTGTPSDSYSGWQDTIPEYNSSTPNYWVKVTNTYSEAPITEVVKYKDTGITNAMAKAADAQLRAATAETNAASALSLSQATQQHFWFNSVKTGNIEAGAYITDVVIDNFKPNKSGNYLLAGSNGIELGNGSHPYMQLTASELNFFHPNSSNVDAQLSSNGLIVKSGGIEAGTVGQNGGIYLSTKDYGTTHNNQTITINGHETTNWRQIIGTKFGVDSDGVLYAGGANIQGVVTVTSGSNVYTTDEVNPLNVGSRNLLISINNTIGVMENIVNDEVGEPISNPRAVLSDTIVIEPNTNYTLQYWLPSELTDTGTNRAGTCKIVWLRLERGTEDEDDFIEHYLGGYELEYFSENWKYYVLKSPSTATHCRVTFIFPASYHEGVVPSDWINGTDGYKWQLEKGNVPTDWVIAPEDLSGERSVQDLFLLTNDGITTEGANYFYEKNVTNDENVTTDNIQDDIITINDNIQNNPLSLIVNLFPMQEGEGTPSADNIRPFGAWTEASVTISPVVEAKESVTRIVSLEQNVYNGSIDMISGILNVKPYYESYNDEELVGEWISDRDEYIEGTKPSIGAQVINIGSSGIDYHLTPQEINFFNEGSQFQSNGRLTIRYLVSRLAEWTSIPQVPDEYNPYVWWKTQRTYLDGNIVESIPIVFNSIPQSELNNIYTRIGLQDTNITQISNITADLSQKNTDLNSSITNINNELADYRKGITINGKIPMVKVFAQSLNEQDQIVESAVTVYSTQIEISGSGNSNTIIDSESFRTNKIVTNTFMPRVGSTGQLAFIARTNGHFSLKVVQGI